MHMAARYQPGVSSLRSCSAYLPCLPALSSSLWFLETGSFTGVCISTMRLGCLAREPQSSAYFCLLTLGLQACATKPQPVGADEHRQEAGVILVWQALELSSQPLHVARDYTVLNLISQNTSPGLTYSFRTLPDLCLPFCGQCCLL